MSTYARLWDLTPRERQVAALVADGLTNPQIATCLGMRGQTVRAHVTNILSKLEVKSREDVAARLGQTESQTAARG